MQAETQKEMNFKKLSKNLGNILIKKNRAYGDSFSKTIDKWGMVAAFVRMDDKWNRMQELGLKGTRNEVENESLEDTIMDMAGYCILLVDYLKSKDVISNVDRPDMVSYLGKHRDSDYDIDQEAHINENEIVDKIRKVVSDNVGRERF